MNGLQRQLNTERAVDFGLMTEGLRKAEKQGIFDLNDLLNLLLTKYLADQVIFDNPNKDGYRKNTTRSGKSGSRLANLERKYRSSKKIYKVSNGTQFVSAVFGQ